MVLPQLKDTEVQASSSQNYVNAIQNQVKNSSNLSYALFDKLQELKGKNNKLEKTLHSKENVRPEGKELFETSSKNLGKLEQVLRQFSDDYKSPLQPRNQRAELTPQQLLEHTQLNINDWGSLNDQVRSLLQDLTKQNQRLEQFKKGVERGENKNNALDDFNDIKTDSKNNYDNLKNILLDQKATPSSLPRLILNNMEEDPVSELEDINRINKGIEDLQLLLQDRLRQQQQELEKLR
jgi:hypothetical protein